MAEFIINDFLSLKLVKDKTEIFINGKSFHQCKFLMMNLLINEIENYDEIGSIDEAADALGWTYDGQEGVKYEIDPESEFWGHCSNLQAWYENDYDTRLLHSNLSFPLLKELSEIGDPVAKRVLKKEIVERFASGYPATITCIFEEHLLDYLNGEEREQIISENFLAILKVIEKLPEKGEFSFLSTLIDESKGTGFIEENYLSFLGFIDKFPDDDIYDVYIYILKLAQNKGLKKEYFLIFLESIKKLPDKDKYDAFYDLISSIQGTGLVNIFYSQIETQFLVLMEDINKINRQSRFNFFAKKILIEMANMANIHIIMLLEIASMTGLIKEHYLLFLKSIEKLYGEEKFTLSSAIIKEIEGNDIENEVTFKIWKQKIVRKNKMRRVYHSIFIRFLQIMAVLFITLVVVTIFFRSIR